MTEQITIRPWLACVGVAMCFVCAYFVETQLVYGWYWKHKVGEAGWLDSLAMVSDEFPFGPCGWDIFGPLSDLGNGLFWGCIGSALCALRLWYQGRRVNPVTNPNLADGSTK